MIPAINKPILVTRHTATTTGCVFTNIIMGNTEINVAIMKNIFPTIFLPFLLQKSKTGRFHSNIFLNVIFQTS